MYKMIHGNNEGEDLTSVYPYMYYHLDSEIKSFYVLPFGFGRSTGIVPSKFR
jgi:hypothetical protein